MADLGLRGAAATDGRDACGSAQQEPLLLPAATAVTGCRLPLPPPVVVTLGCIGVVTTGRVGRWRTGDLPVSLSPGCATQDEPAGLTPLRAVGRSVGWSVGLVCGLWSDLWSVVWSSLVDTLNELEAVLTDAGDVVMYACHGTLVEDGTGNWPGRRVSRLEPTVGGGRGTDVIESSRS